MLFTDVFLELLVLLELLRARRAVKQAAVRASHVSREVPPRGGRVVALAAVEGLL